MTDLILSSFLSLFALFGKKEQVDEAWAKTMLMSYLRHHLGIRNTDSYLDFYSDMRAAYEMTPDLDITETVSSICSNLHGKVSAKEEAFLLLRLMEFCSGSEENADNMFAIIAEKFHIPEEQYHDFADFVNNRQTERVILHQLQNTDGFVKTLLDKGVKVVVATRGDAPALAAAIGDDRVVAYAEPSATYGSCKWDAWKRACRLNGLHEMLTAAVTGSGFGVRAALVAGMSALGVTNDHVAWQDFGGADEVVDTLDKKAADAVLKMLKVA